MNQNKTNQVKAKILIADDVPANLNLLRETLESEGYQISGVPSGEIALKVATRTIPDLILLDVVMNGIDGFETCRRLKADPSTADIPVIFVTIKEKPEEIVNGFQVGGVDYITKPFQKEEVIVRVENHLKISQLTKTLAQKNSELEARTAELIKANQKLQQEISMREQAEDALQKADEQLNMISQQEASRWGIAGFVGKSKTIEKILDDVRQLQSAGTTSVLITGESGTGKELIARAIHSGGTRAKGPFIPVNCSTIPSGLAESTLFGHVRGAFTGANTNRKGYFELADGGTLFLDEIGDMPLELQPKLLRTLEDGVVTPVGGTDAKRISVRFIAASNQKLREKFAEGTFREDLYFRLARFTVEVPPLRERREDIPLLIEHFLRMFSTEMGIEKATLSPEALSDLTEYHFPGNIRELKNIIEHALIKSGGSTILPEHLYFTDTKPQPSTSVAMFNIEHSRDIEQTEALLIRRAQTQTKGSDKDSISRTDEETILAYIKKNGSISNAECRDLLSADIQRASYLLKKMHQYGLLKREGERRWAYYRLAEENQRYTTTGVQAS